MGNGRGGGYWRGGGGGEVENGGEIRVPAKREEMRDMVGGCVMGVRK